MDGSEGLLELEAVPIDLKRGLRGSRRLVPADELQKAGLGTLLGRRLTADEERVDLRNGRYRSRFPVAVLAVGVTDWLHQDDGTNTEGAPVSSVPAQIPTSLQQLGLAPWRRFCRAARHDTRKD
jgi:hypothetical protein